MILGRVRVLRNIDIVGALLGRITRLLRKLSFRFGLGRFPLTQANSDNIVGSQRGICLRKFQERTINIPGMSSMGESEALLYISLLSSVKGDIVEIGSWLGRSTIFLAEGCKLSDNGMVHAVDTFLGDPGNEALFRKPLKGNETIYDKFIQNIKEAGLGEFVKSYQMSSKEARNLIDTPLKILFIDGAHDYESVRADIITWQDLLLPNGYIILHDFRAEAPECVRAIDEMVIQSPRYECLLLVDSLLIAKRIAD